MSSLLPLIKWSGGKRDEIKEFLPFIPDFDTYIEPFAGGAALYFYLNHLGNNVINDIHPDLINFYTQISLGNSFAIHNLMSQYGLDEQSYYQVRGHGAKLKLKPFNPHNDLERAFQFYYLRKTCYRGMLRYNSDGLFNIPWGKYKTMDYSALLNKDYEELLGNTTILNTSYELVFKAYNRPNNFVFLDPPYDSVFSDYGFDDFNRKNHLQLAELFKSTRNKCMLVIAETDFIRETYADCNIVHEYEKKYAFKLHSGRVGQEIDKKHLIILNY